MDIKLTLSDEQEAAHQTLYDKQKADALSVAPIEPYPDFVTWLTSLLMMSVVGVTQQQSSLADAAAFAKFSALPTTDKATVTATIDSAFSKM